MNSTPKTTEALSAENKLLRFQNQGLEDRLDELEELIRLLQRGKFAAKSEGLQHPGMKSLFEEEDEYLKPDEVDQNEKKNITVEEHTRTITRKPLPESLPRVDVFCDLPDAEKICSCCDMKMSKTPEKTSEKLHIKPAEFLVKRFITPVYGCKNCEYVKQARMPSHPIPKCGVTLETLAYIATAKYADGLPLYRLEKIFARSEADISRDRMSRWMISLAEKLAPIKNELHSELIAGNILGMDETTMQVLKEKDRRADQKSYMIVQAREGPPGKSITLFHYEKSRSAVTMKSYLKGFNGSMVTDGLASYQTFTRSISDVSHGGCMAHCRRKFAEAVKGKKKRIGIAKEGLLLIKKLFKIEDELKGLSQDIILATRKEKSQPIIDLLKYFLEKNILRIPKKSLTGKALHYMSNQWEYLTRFLEDPKLPIHNNYVERQIKQFVIGRKAWLFADSTKGAEASALFYSLLNTAKQNGIEPYKYLVHVFSKIDSDIEIQKLLPLK